MSKNTISNRYEHVIHMADDVSRYCNSLFGKITTDPEEVTCNKCKALLDPKKLAAKRSADAKRPVPEEGVMSKKQRRKNNANLQ